MGYIKKHKTEIIFSTIIGILLFYIQPLLAYLGSKFINFLLFISNKFSIDYYQRLAENDVNSFDELSNFLLIAIFSLISVGTYLFILNKKRELKKDISNILSGIKGMKNKINPIKKESIPEEEILSRILKTEASAMSLQGKLGKRDNFLISSTIITSFLIIILFYNHIITSSVANKNVKFRNELYVIEPYVGADEIKQLKSSWTRIKTKADFDKITNEVDSIKQKNGIN